jgi:hypothetical protein
METVRDFGKYFFSSNVIGSNTAIDFSKITPESLEKDAVELLDNSNDII